jgi:hypothetical protein
MLVPLRPEPKTIQLRIVAPDVFEPGQAPGGADWKNAVLFHQLANQPCDSGRGSIMKCNSRIFDEKAIPRVIICADYLVPMISIYPQKTDVSLRP